MGPLEGLVSLVVVVARHGESGIPNGRRARSRPAFLEKRQRAVRRIELPERELRLQKIAEATIPRAALGDESL